MSGGVALQALVAHAQHADISGILRNPYLQIETMIRLGDLTLAC